MRILIVDEHPLMRQGLVHFLSQMPDVRVIGEACDCRDGYDIISTLQPDLVVFDTSLADVRGVEILRHFRAHFPDIRALVYTTCSSPDELTSVMYTNVQGVVLTTSSVQCLFEAVQTIAMGKYYLDPALADMIHTRQVGRVGPEGTPASLTPRQAAILDLICSGMANKEIANRLDISERTVKFHVGCIFNRLNVRSRLEAVRAAWHKPLTTSPGMSKSLTQQRLLTPEAANHYAAPPVDPSALIRTSPQ